MVLRFRTPQFASLGGFASLMARALDQPAQPLPRIFGLFLLVGSRRSRQTPSPRPERTDEMDTDTTSSPAIGAGGSVGLRAAFSHAIPSADDCGCQGASSHSPRIRSNHDAVTANVTNMGPTEQAGLIYDCL